MHQIVAIQLKGSRRI